MSDVVNNSNIDCLQGNTTYITLTFGSGDICRIALKAVNITLLLSNIVYPLQGEQVDSKLCDA